MEPFATYPDAASPASGPSSAQKALAVVGILLGALGVIGGCCGAVSGMASGTLLQAQGELLGAEGMPGAEQQRAIVAASQELVEKYAPLSVLVQLLNLLASTLLIAAGALTLRGHANARPLVFIACGANVVVDAGLAAVTLLQQLETARITSQLMSIPSADPNVARVMESSMRAGMFAGVCFYVGWFVVKLAFYLTNTLVARRSAA